MIGTVVFAAMMSLAGSEWGPADNQKQSLQFRDGRLSGNSGCNRFSATYRQEGEQLVIGPVASTKMACLGPENAMEAAWFDMISRIRSIDATHLKLILKDERGQVIATLQRRDFD
jgi:heat shock protein HslJ